MYSVLLSAWVEEGRGGKILHVVVDGGGGEEERVREGGGKAVRENCKRSDLSPGPKVPAEISCISTSDHNQVL